MQCCQGLAPESECQCHKDEAKARLGQIVFEPAECDCRDGMCDALHSPGWWVWGVSFETEKEALAHLAKVTACR
jgi:hypothetical protein